MQCELRCQGNSWHFLVFLAMGNRISLVGLCQPFSGRFRGLSTYTPQMYDSNAIEAVITSAPDWSWQTAATFKQYVKSILPLR